MNQYELPLLYRAQRLETERLQARLRAEAELGAGVSRHRPLGRGLVAAALAALAARRARGAVGTAGGGRPAAGGTRS